MENFKMWLNPPCSCQGLVVLCVHNRVWHRDREYGSIVLSSPTQNLRALYAASRFKIKMEVLFQGGV